MMAALLKVDGLEAGYGKSQVLFGMALEIQAGQCVTLLGRNGMGKSTTIKSILGLVQPMRGEVRWNGDPVQGKPPYAIARLGLGLVPEGRQIFPNLTVRENLVPLLRLADRHHIVEKGVVVWSGDSDALRADKGAMQRYLSV